MKKLLVFALFSLASCPTLFAQRAIQEYRNVQARVGNGVAEVHVRPTIVDVIPSSTKIETVLTLSAKDVAALGGDVAEIRAWAAYMVTGNYDCDILLNPVFLIQTNDAGGVDVNVKGWPGTFSNWHQADDKDFEWLKYEHNWAKSEKELTAPVLTKQ